MVVRFIAAMKAWQTNSFLVDSKISLRSRVFLVRYFQAIDCWIFLVDPPLYTNFTLPCQPHASLDPSINAT